ncbi:App1 family protein [uncultured Microscilla sp.]|uniref:phosphatase domain-containing protein n=1 Tax=uncultured Microscilla sp. TaxID=432653 RepID=UPI002627444C|nr:App1 family protein [uncultured Microscilla sp.]
MHVWQFAAVQFNQKVLITGTLLRGKPRSSTTSSTWLGHFIRMMRSYFHPVCKHQSLTIYLGNQQQASVTTNYKGYFSTMVEGQVTAELRLEVAGQSLELPTHYPVVFDRTNANIEVVSDIDDTILLSHTASFIKRIGTILFRRPKKRRTIVFSHGLFKQFKNFGTRVIYLSKSESNLFGLISAVVQYQQLPEGPLLLTPYLSLRQLFNAKKGKDYKFNFLKLICENLPNKKLVLMGDDSQRDMEIYTQVAKMYPDKILKVYIRQTGFRRNEEQWQKLEETGVNAMYFNDADSAEKESELLKELKQAT